MTSDKVSPEEFLNEIKDQLLDLIDLHFLPPRILTRVEKIIFKIEDHLHPSYDYCSEILHTKIEDTSLSPSIKRFLKYSNVQEVKDLVGMSHKDLCYLPNIGRKSIKDIKGFLRLNGLHLGMHLPTLQDIKDA